MGYGGGGGGGGGSGGSGGGSGASGGSGYRRVGDDRTANLKVNNITNRTGTDGTEVDGIVEVNTTAHFIPPSGTTAERGSRGRGIFAGGYQGPANQNTIDYITIATLGNATDFGERNNTGARIFASCSSSTRSLFGGGYSPTTSTIDYIEIHSTGNGFKFGDLLDDKYGVAAASNSTRGIFAGGHPNAGTYKQIQYVTIASKGDATSFGDLTIGRAYPNGLSSPTRMIIGGGYRTPGAINSIEYITIATTGNAQDFGDLTEPAYGTDSGASSPTRGLFAGNDASSGVTRRNIIDYVTIATLGDATDFGDLTEKKGAPGGTSNSIRAVFAGGNTSGPSPHVVVNTIEYVTIATTGNATDFGDRTVTASYVAGSSDSHGGLG